MARTTTFIIVGAGLAGVKGAEALRDNGFDGRILLLGSEEQLPYERPPLSKDFLAGKTTLGEFTVVDAAWFRDHHVDVLPGAEVTGVDRHKQAITTADGTAFSYDKLLLATGSRSRRPDLPGAQADGVHYLRTVGESEALRAALTEGARLGIVGGGWIGLEVAAVARERGVAVTVVESARLPLLGALGPQIAAVFADLHRAHGVDLRTDTGVTEITTRDGRATGLLLDLAVWVAGWTVAAARFWPLGCLGLVSWQFGRRHLLCLVKTPLQSDDQCQVLAHAAVSAALLVCLAQIGFRRCKVVGQQIRHSQIGKYRWLIWLDIQRLAVFRARFFRPLQLVKDCSIGRQEAPVRIVRLLGTLDYPQRLAEIARRRQGLAIG